MGTLANRLRCDRALPACHNCLINLPQAEPCDYSLTRDYLDLLNSRHGSKRPRHDEPSLPTPQPSAASPPKENEGEEDDNNEDDSISTAASNTSGVDGDDEDSDSTKTTAHDGLREKLERLERLINGLVESHKCHCENKKKMKKESELKTEDKMETRYSDDELDDDSETADDNQSANSRIGESAWGSFISEVSGPFKFPWRRSEKERKSLQTIPGTQKVNAWQQKLGRHPASENSSRTHLSGTPKT